MDVRKSKRYRKTETNRERWIGAYSWTERQHKGYDDKNSWVKQGDQKAGGGLGAKAKDALHLAFLPSSLPSFLPSVRPCDGALGAQSSFVVFLSSAFALLSCLLASRSLACFLASSLLLSCLLSGLLARKAKVTKAKNHKSQTPKNDWFERLCELH